MKKIAIIGAGSVVFSKQLMADILGLPEFKDCTFSLMDIDPVRLGMIEKVAKMFIAQHGNIAKVEVTEEMSKALKDAKYVICLVQVGGFPSTIKDFEIPAKYGLKQTIADTLGVGGVFRALRTIPVLDSICQNMEKLCPDAILLNYTNPMAILSSYVLKKYPGIKYIGLCHSVQTTTKQLALYMNKPYKELKVKVAGINHQAWFLELSHDGEDCYPHLNILKERILNESDFVPEHLFHYSGKDTWFRENFKDSAADTFATDKVRFELLNRLGYYVTESSEHNAEYCPYFIKDDALIKEYKIPINEYIRRCKLILSEFDDMKSLINEGKELHVDLSEEYAGYILHSIETGTDININGNVLNTGLITNLPDKCCVEVPCLVNKNGVQPTFVGELPPQLAAYNRTNINVQLLATEAALTGKREYAYHAVMFDPLASSILNLEQIWKMCDELFEAHKDFIKI
ncbi:MAG TPA: alpha-glucosidase/alpha-galactosidase [Bacteroidales bacterium]|nr:alpha-glucosidase/alpha-galactosidase [Bacteroidales bacterium]